MTKEEEMNNPFGAKYPTGGDQLQEYLRLTAQKLGRMPSSGSTTASRPPAPQTKGVPIAGGDGGGFWTGMGKQLGSTVMNRGVNWASNKLFTPSTAPPGDAFQNYMTQWQLSQANPYYQAGGAGVNSAGAEYYGGDMLSGGLGGGMDAGMAAGGGMDMASGLGGGGADLSMVAF